MADASGNDNDTTITTGVPQLGRLPQPGLQALNDAAHRNRTHEPPAGERAYRA